MNAGQVSCPGGLQRYAFGLPASSAAPSVSPASLHPVASSAKIPVMREGVSNSNEPLAPGNAAAAK